MLFCWLLAYVSLCKSLYTGLSAFLSAPGIAQFLRSQLQMPLGKDVVKPLLDGAFMGQSHTYFRVALP